jgi:hypothetical protein
MLARPGDTPPTGAQSSPASSDLGENLDEMCRGSVSADSRPTQRFYQWARLGSNQGPTDYESAALTS